MFTSIKLRKAFLLGGSASGKKIAVEHYEDRIASPTFISGKTETQLKCTIQTSIAWAGEVVQS